MMTLRKPLFHLGQVVATPAALEALAGAGTSPKTLLARHLHGDWGDLDADDRAANDAAVAEGDRIFTAYQVSEELRVWVITDADRSVTTVLLPEDY